MNYFKAIVAIAENGVIGYGNKIPWHLPADLKWFKNTTMGHTIVMGRKTFESIGKPLPGRETIVLSKSGFSANGVKIISSLSEIPQVTGSQTVFICGGATVYQLALPYCSDLYITHIKGNYIGDVFFPDYKHLFQIEEVIADFPTHQIVHYVNPAPLKLPSNEHLLA